MITFASLVVAGSAGAADTDETYAEYQLKAAYLYNLPQFIDWPANTSSSTSDEGGTHLTLCIIGPDPFGPLIGFFSGRPSKNAKFRVDHRSAEASLAGCPMVFIGTQDPDSQSRILRRLAGSAVLTVGEMPDFTRRGGIVRFVLSDERVALEINTDAAEAAGLSISAKLLRLADIVHFPVPKE